MACEEGPTLVPAIVAPGPWTEKRQRTRVVESVSRFIANCWPTNSWTAYT